MGEKRKKEKRGAACGVVSGMVGSGYISNENPSSRTAGRPRWSHCPAEGGVDAVHGVLRQGGRSNFGGLAFTRGGQAERVERLIRERMAMSIPGGSEEIMLDLGVRQALRSFPKL